MWMSFSSHLISPPTVVNQATFLHVQPAHNHLINTFSNPAVMSAVGNQPPFTWHFESRLPHSHAQANPDSIGIRSRLNPDYRILVRRWIISGFRSEIPQSRSQAHERARKVGGKRDAYGASFPNSLKSCAGAAIIATFPNAE